MINTYFNRLLHLIDSKPKGERSLNQTETNMEYTTLGRTGLKVSVIGLGGGGPSRLGQGTGKTEDESIAVVHRALDLGINLFDLAEPNGTEGIVGKALKNIKREDVVVSTKKGIWQKDIRVTAKEMAKGVENSLRRLRTDYVDIFQFHSLRSEEYQYAVTELLPVLFKMRDQGKIRFIGIGEKFTLDPQHKMLERALQDNYWDVMLVGFNILNQSARERVLTKAMEQNIGVLIMYAIRRTFSSLENLKQAIIELEQKGLVDPALIDKDEPLGFLFHNGGAVSLSDAACRYCRYEPGVHTVLCGTGNIEHLKANFNSILHSPLPDSDLLKLKVLFAKVDEFIDC